MFYFIPFTSSILILEIPLLSMSLNKIYILGVKMKEVDSIPYWPVQPIFTVPIPPPIQKHGCFVLV